MKHTTKNSIIGTSIIAAAFAITVLPSLASADTLYRQLEIKMQGSDVSSLKSFLAQDNTIYPQGLVTGYFGGLTKSAVSNFQARNGLPAVGRVGPATLPVINAQMAAGMNNGGVTTVQAPSISTVNVAVNGNVPTITWSTNVLTKGVVFYSASPLVTYERVNSVDISGSSIMTDTNFRSNQSIAIPNLLNNTVYYFMIYTTDQNGNVSVTAPSTFKTSN